ncbi:DUF2568 domain-containing protein [Companilactobacillus bobalius]|uniref:DUF2568 domain-containing protein n=1 Tax=Companilactobacillus bobalius TaxID=2801451 RepID=A0A202FG73_9LACO|nr:hypothetical protein LKACC16343_00589 [Companilactobacillus bobalius]
MNLLTFNALIRFLIEITTAILIITIDLTKYSLPLNILIGIILPIIFLLWRLFVAPHSSRQGSTILQIFIELIVFGTCTYLTVSKLSIITGLTYLLITFLNTIIIHIGNTLS